MLTDYDYTAPSTLLTLDELKDRLGKVFSCDDETLTRQGEVVTQLIREYCGQPINSVTITATIYNPDTVELVLLNTPIATVTSATLDSSTVDNLVFNKARGRLWSKTREFRGEELVVVYTGGHVTIPADLADLYAQLVQSRVERGGASAGAGQSVKSLTVFGSHSVSYSDDGGQPGGPGGEIEAFSEILDRYRAPEVLVG